MPTAWAAATSAAPGSATAGQPASETNPSDRPAFAGARREARSACEGFSGSARIASSAIGRGWPIDFRKARAAFGVSTTHSSIARAAAIVRAGSTLSGGTAPSRLGTR